MVGRVIMKVIMREEFPKSGENALNPEVSVEAGTEPPKKKVDSNVIVSRRVRARTDGSNSIVFFRLRLAGLDVARRHSKKR